MNITGYTPEDFDRIFSGAGKNLQAMQQITNGVTNLFNGVGENNVVQGFSDSRRNTPQQFNMQTGGYTRPVDYAYGYANNQQQNQFYSFGFGGQTASQNGCHVNSGYPGFFNPNYGGGVY